MDKQFDNKYQDIIHRFQMVYGRLEAIESKCGCKVKFKEQIERRLVSLEAKMTAFINLIPTEQEVTQDAPAPTKPCGCLVGHSCAADKPSEVKDEHIEECVKSGLVCACDKCIKERMDMISIPRSVAEEAIKFELPNELYDAIKVGLSK